MQIAYYDINIKKLKIKYINQKVWNNKLLTVKVKYAYI
jgi:hypothetical protein